MEYEALSLYDKAMEYCNEVSKLFVYPRYKSMAGDCYRRNAERVKHRQDIESKPSGFREIPVIDDDTLFVVNYTRVKIWDIARETGFNILRSMLAALAYQGDPSTGSYC